MKSATNWGYNESKNLLIFEGHWGSLVGLYLDGFGHREPLFDQVAVTPAPRAVVTTQPVIVPRPVVARTSFAQPTFRHAISWSTGGPITSNTAT